MHRQRLLQRRRLHRHLPVVQRRARRLRDGCEPHRRTARAVPRDHHLRQHGAVRGRVVPAGGEHGDLPAASCAGASFQPTATCTGSGSCAVPGAVDCSPFACNASGCLGSCNLDGDCASGLYCTGAGGSCQPKRLAGQACATDNQCGSSHCTEGVCCGSAACPSCQSCAVSGLEGTCSDVPPGGVDPTGSCVDQGAASCGQSGRCNGTGGCALYGAATVCATSCGSDGVTLNATYCDGAGTCGPATSPTTCPNICTAGPPAACN